MSENHFIKQLIPPILEPILRTIYNKARGVFTGKYYEIKYIPEGWDYAHSHPEIKGWDVAEWVETRKRDTLALKEMFEKTDPLVPYNQDPTTKQALIDHNRMMILAYALALASRDKDSISILDWGGDLGQNYYAAKALLPAEISISFCCKEVPSIVNHGTRFYPEINFCSDDSCLDPRYELVMSHGSFYYSQDWQNTLFKLARASVDYLLITRVPFVTQVPSYVSLERLYQFGYEVETLCWTLNRSDFLNESKRLNLTLVREFITGQTYQIRGASEQPIFRGFLFRVLGKKFLDNKTNHSSGIL